MYILSLKKLFKFKTLSIFRMIQLVINDLFHFCTTQVSPKRDHQVIFRMSQQKRALGWMKIGPNLHSMISTHT